MVVLDTINLLMYELTLQELGLSPNEARIYEALLELGEAGVSSISTQTNIHRRNVYDTINRLVEKGFATPVVGTKENKYIPVEPNKFLEVIQEKKEKLQKILPNMQSLFLNHKAEEGVYIYKGIEGMKNILRDILRINQSVYTIGGKGIWSNPISLSLSESFVKETQKKNIKFCTLFDLNIKDEVIKNIKTIKQTNIEYRFLPEKYSSSSVIDIYGNRVAIYTGATLHETIEESITIFLMVSQNLADSYRQWFQFMWDRCSSK